MSGRRLVYVMGASGAGKDTLLEYARAELRGEPVVFARRCVTRPAEAGGEDHMALTRDEYRDYLEQGLFAMHWAANGLDYGVGTEIDTWMGLGLLVVVNGSREAFPVVIRRYPQMIPVLVTAHENRIRARLQERGREDPEAIEARLIRSQNLNRDLPEAVEITNNGSLAQAGDRLTGLLRSLLRLHATA